MGLVLGVGCRAWGSIRLCKTRSPTKSGSAMNGSARPHALPLKARAGFHRTAPEVLQRLRPSKPRAFFAVLYMGFIIRTYRKQDVELPTVDVKHPA